MELDETLAYRAARQLAWYQRRVKALEGLLACYRLGKQPSEKLFRELELTGQNVGHDGSWRGDA